MSSRSSVKIEPKEVQEILQGNEHISAKPNPVEHVASPASPALSRASSGRASFQSHTRTMSIATDATTTTAPRSNRWSTSFPVQPSGSMSPVRTSQSPVREAFPVAPEPASAPNGPMDTNFLTAIAAQERRVLELKEELSRAEADLAKLKKQWAQHEAQKKRNDAKSLTKLQPLQTSLPDADAGEDTDGSNAWMQQEMERRKALMSGNKSSSRTVFSGSRHTRTLSLLSPVSRTPTTMPPPPRPERPPRKDSLSSSGRQSEDIEPPPRLNPISRAATTPDMTVDGTKLADSLAELADAGVDRDMLLQTGKKVATGLKDGLWTFWEDLRQATVGEDSTPIPPPRRQSSTQTLRTAKEQSSKHSLRPSSRGSTTSKASTDTKRTATPRRKSKSKTMSFGAAPALADPSFWTDHYILPPNECTAPAKKAPSPSRHTKSPSKAISVESSDMEAWDAWDEGSPDTLPTSVSNMTSPRLSVESNFDYGPNDTIKPRNNRHSVGASGKKDPIPWPALSNLGPKALRRTASHLMSEWEKSLTPSPTKDYRDSDDYLGLGAEAAAAEVSGERKKD